MGLSKRLLYMTGAGIGIANGWTQLNCRRKLRAAEAAFKPGQAGDHVVVIGAGVVGVTTAYELVKKGFKVTVIERQSQPAMETSHANAGTLNYVIRTLTASPENLQLALHHMATHLLGNRTIQDDIVENSAVAGQPASGINAASVPDPQDKSLVQQLEEHFDVTLPDLEGILDDVLEKYDQLDVQQAVDDLISSVDLDAELESIKNKFNLTQEIDELVAYVQDFRLQQKMDQLLGDFKFFGVDARLMQTLDFWKWSINFALLCFWETEQRRKYVNELVDYSLNALVETTQAEPQIEFNFRQNGSIALFFNRDQFDQERARVVPERDTILTRAEAIALEPSLERINFVGAIRHSKDRVGNCSQYVQSLAQACEGRGVEFKFQHTASDLNVHQGRCTSVTISDKDGQTSELPCDYVVLCGGVESNTPLVSSGWRWLPLMPVRGYSITGKAATGANQVPQDYVLLENPLHVISVRFGDKIRFASHAEITMAVEPDADRLNDLRQVIHAFFPQAFADGDDSLELWMGRRPMTADSMPIVGVGHLPNLILCTGHGGDGWRWSTGTARLTASLLKGEPLPLPTKYLSLSRFFFF